MYYNKKKKRPPPTRDATVADLMNPRVMTTSPSRSSGHVREIMARHRIHAMPVVDAEMAPIGIVTSSDLIDEVSDTTPVHRVMTRDVVTVPLYADPATAARTMRNRRIHHLVVCNEKKVVGILSSFDLLRLVENHRFVAKNPATRKRKKNPQEHDDAKSG